MKLAREQLPRADRPREQAHLGRDPPRSKELVARQSRGDEDRSTIFLLVAMVFTGL